MNDTQQAHSAAHAALQVHSAKVTESNKVTLSVGLPKSPSKSASILKSNSPSFGNIKQSSTSFADIKQSMDIERNEGEEDKDNEDENEGLYGVAQSLAIHAPKKSAGNMSRMSRGSNSSERGDRMNQIFIMPFIRAATQLSESRAGRFVANFLNKVTTKVIFWSFLSLVNISVILLIFFWSAG
jgi:hypothetical protein